MTTRSGARVYRGVARRRPADACPHCGKTVGVRADGRRRSHTDLDGVECTGSGVAVRRDDVDDATVTAGLELAAQIPDPPTPPGRPRAETAPETPPAIPGDRVAKERCPECGRPTPRNGDGTLRGHHVRADDPYAPRCPGGNLATRR